jgi:hypothetical protein
MANLRQMRQISPICCLAIALAIGLGGCSTIPRETAASAAACNVLAKSMADQEDAFVAHAQTIRAQHLLLQDYDREMIAALNGRRKALLATQLTELTVSDEVAGCSGKQLDDLRSRALQELANVRDYLNEFRRALKTDPEGVFIDQP